jgi:hypothetical protein
MPIEYCRVYCTTVQDEDSVPKQKTPTNAVFASRLYTRKQGRKLRVLEWLTIRYNDLNPYPITQYR